MLGHFADLTMKLSACFGKSSRTLSKYYIQLVSQIDSNSIPITLIPTLTESLKFYAFLKVRLEFHEISMRAAKSCLLCES